MGKSSTLHCEVQLLDDQSTVLDLDVSLTYFVNEYFGSKMEDIPLHTISLNAAISLSANITNSLRCCVILLWLRATKRNCKILQC